MRSCPVKNDPYGEAYFEGRGSNYWWTIGSYGNLRRFPHWEGILNILRNLRDQGRLLDIGCAYGLFVDIACKYYDSFGVDISRFAVKMSRRHCRGRISRASADNLPFKPEVFDIVTAVDSLEHVSHLRRCLDDIFRVLKEDGILFLQLPNPLIWTGLCGRLGLGDDSHMNELRLDSWKGMLRNHGFKVCECFGLVSYAYKKLRLLVKSKGGTSLFPEWWVIAKKNAHARV